MSDEQENVGAGSETSGEVSETTVSETNETSETAQSTTDASAEVAAEQKAGDACTCPDGRIGTLHANEDGTFTCIPNQG